MQCEDRTIDRFAGPCKRGTSMVTVWEVVIDVRFEEEVVTDGENNEQTEPNRR